jgi:succinate dehydrogenase / fumarate reductase flavoprotein subunit/L-aspartate oxidase
LATLLEGDSPIHDDQDLTPHYTTDVLVIGGGGAGCAAALHAHGAGSQVMLATKLRLGDSNSVMAQGGMQISVAPEDSPVTHFIDTLKGGHMQNDHALLKVMVEDGPAIAKWLIELGVLFDRQADGNLHVKKGGGSSKPRLLTCSDYTGLEIMRVLKDEVINQKIQLLEFCAAVELLSDEDGRCSGAVFKDLDNQRHVVVAAKSWPPVASAGCTFKASRPATIMVRRGTDCAFPTASARNWRMSTRSNTIRPAQSILNN